MTPGEIQAYITVIAAFYSLGISVAGKVKELLKLFHPDVVLTEEEINAIEAAGIAESQRRLAERRAMADATGEP